LLNSLAAFTKLESAAAVIKADETAIETAKNPLTQLKVAIPA
jgi:hypothetical protein